jgi:hypothetical protein
LRPTAETLLSHPFFTLTDAEENAAMLDAKAYNSGAGPVNVMVQQHVIKPLHELTMQSAKLTNAQQKVDLALSIGATDIDGAHNDHLFDVGTFCDVLNSASSFLHGGGESSFSNSAAAEGSRVAHSSRWSPSERLHAAELMFSNELMVGGILPKIVACALRFVTSDQGSMTGYDFENAAAVGGSANATLGQRLMSRIVRFFESVLLETRPIAEGGNKLKDGPATPYVSSILEALVKLYLGEEAGLASIYGKGRGFRIDFSGFGGSNFGYDDISHIKGGVKISKSTKWGPFGRDMEGVNHWSPNFMNVIEPVLLLAVTESGGGNHLYAPIVDFIRASKVKIEAGDEDATVGGGGDDDDDDDDLVGTESGAVTTVKPFMRTSLYFSELVSLGRTFANLAAASRGQGRTGARARRSCVSFILTMVRLWGLKEGGGAAEGLSARPDALSSMQRAQLLLDVRVASKLLPYVADYDAKVRRDVLTSALAALSTGMPLLGGNTGNVANPHAALGLEFCSKGWSEAFGKALVSGGSTKDDAACRKLAAKCLERMVSAGDVACEGWGVAGVVGNLVNALTDNRRAGDKDGALAVFEALASSSAPNVSKLLQAHPSILNFFRVYKSRRWKRWMMKTFYDRRRQDKVAKREAAERAEKVRATARAKDLAEAATAKAADVKITAAAAEAAAARMKGKRLGRRSRGGSRVVAANTIKGRGRSGPKGGSQPLRVNTPEYAARCYLREMRKSFNEKRAPKKLKQFCRCDRPKHKVMGKSSSTYLTDS